MTSGYTRYVFFMKNNVIKIPKLTSFKYFIHGIVSNIKEARTYRKADIDDRKLLAPTKFSCLGLMNIQTRCHDVTDKWYMCDSEMLKVIHESSVRMLCVDSKPENFGKINGKTVCLDYAW